MKAKEEEMAALQTTLSFLETHEEEVAALEEDRNDLFTQFIITPNERNTEQNKSCYLLLFLLSVNHSHKMEEN